METKVPCAARRPNAVTKSRVHTQIMDVLLRVGGVVEVFRLTTVADDHVAQNAC